MAWSGTRVECKGKSGGLKIELSIFGESTG